MTHSLFFRAKSPPCGGSHWVGDMRYDLFACALVHKLRLTVQSSIQPATFLPYSTIAGHENSYMIPIHRRAFWWKPTALIAFVGLAGLGILVGTLDGSTTTSMNPSHRSVVRASLNHPSVSDDHSRNQSVTSVRNIVDPTADGYTTPTDPSRGVLGAFPGDTTILVEQDQYLVAARLIGTPGDSLLVQWGDKAYAVIAVYGGGLGWKQRYVTIHEDRHFMLPIQWDEKSNTWESYSMQNWFAGGEPATPRFEDSFEGRCTECHNEDRVTNTGVVVGVK
jgi:hypothetical protein